jgi:hypothetical protein
LKLLEFFRDGLPHFGDEALLTGPNSPEILLCLAQAEYPIWPTAHLLRIVFILPVVFPKTNGAELKVASAK